MKYLWTRIIVALAAVMLLLGFLAVPTAAAQPVKVSLAFPGSSGWSITNIAPGDHGTQTVTVKNDGSSAGKLQIWVENIIGVAGTPPPSSAGSTKSRYLKDYLLLGVSTNSTTIHTNIGMPAVVSKFPQSSTDLNYILTDEIGAGASVDLVWSWELPGPTTGNEVQGASLSFDIKYGLEEVAKPVTGGGAAPPTTESPTPSQISKPTPATTATATTTPIQMPTTRIIELDVPQASDTSGITDDGEVVGELAATTPDKTFSLSIDPGTFVAMSNENRENPTDFSTIGDTVVEKIVVTNPDPAATELPPLPEGWIPVSKYYDINGVTKGVKHGVQLDKPAALTIWYEENKLPNVVDALACFYYDIKLGWVQLAPPEGFIAEGPYVGAETNHFTLFIVLAKPGGGTGSSQAKIVIQTLTVNPSRIPLDSSSDVTVRVANVGAMPGESYIAIKVDGKVQKIQPVKLKPGESTEFQVTLNPANTGIYLISAGSLSSNLIVYSTGASEAENSWWIWLTLLVGLLAIVLIVLYFIRKPKSLLKPIPVVLPGSRQIDLEVVLARTSSGISPTGVTADKLAGTTTHKEFSLNIEEGTRIVISNEHRPDKADFVKIGEHIPDKIEVVIPPMESIPALPEDWIPISSPYEVDGVTNNIKHGLKLDRPALMVIRYNKKLDPAGNEPPIPINDISQTDGTPLARVIRAIFSYDYRIGWVQLDPPADYIAIDNEVAAEVDHFSLFIALAKVEKESPPSQTFS